MLHGGALCKKGLIKHRGAERHVECYERLHNGFHIAAATPPLCRAHGSPRYMHFCMAAATRDRRVMWYGVPPCVRELCRGRVALFAWHLHGAPIVPSIWNFLSKLE